MFQRELEWRKPKGRLPPPRHPEAGSRPATEQPGPSPPATAAVSFAAVANRQRKRSKGPKQTPVVQASPSQAPSQAPVPPQAKKRRNLAASTKSETDQPLPNISVVEPENSQPSPAPENPAPALEAASPDLPPPRFPNAGKKKRQRKPRGARSRAPANPAAQSRQPAQRVKTDVIASVPLPSTSARGATPGPKKPLASTNPPIDKPRRSYAQTVSGHSA